MVGKATQARLLEQALLSRGFKTTTEEIPYQDRLTHSLLYEMLEQGSARSSPDAFQAIQCLNRIHFWQHYLPTLAMYHNVIVLDRWTLSTEIYGAAGGAHPDVTAHLLRHVCPADLNLVIDAPPWPKPDRDVLERDNPFQSRVRTLYQEACAQDPVVNVKIDGARPVAVVHHEMLEVVLGRLGRR